MNTKMTYLYRDADNYKTWQEIILVGEPKAEDIKTIADAMDRLEGEYFIPEQLDLPLNRGWEYNPEVDHPYCELRPYEDIEPTDEAPTDNRTLHELAQEFTDVGYWDDVFYTPDYNPIDEEEED